MLRHFGLVIGSEYHLNILGLGGILFFVLAGLTIGKAGLNSGDALRRFHPREQRINLLKRLQRR